MISGHISICKVYKDGTKEIVMDKHNLVTAGLGLTIANLFTGTGAKYIEEYAPRYFQLGNDTIDYELIAPSAYFYKVSGALGWADYGPDSDIEVKKAYRGFLVSSNDDGATYNEHLLASATSFSSIIYSGTDEYFGVTTAARTTKYYMDSFSSEIVIDEKSANGIDLTEIGLYAKNPRGLREDSPFLIAYKKFDAIGKVEEFSLVIHWTIGFLGGSTVDNHYSPGGRDKGGPDDPTLGNQQGTNGYFKID
tara:strand:+ start:26235 stop:26984 length:750 start_codon:yes stop_codon:yes gene_type:complete